MFFFFKLIKPHIYNLRSSLVSDFQWTSRANRQMYFIGLWTYGICDMVSVDQI